jgi:hypothetical protein
MYAALYDYLLFHGQLILPGIGRISRHRIPAVSDFPNRQFLPPVYTWQFTPGDTPLPERFYEQLQAWLPERSESASRQFEQLCNQIRTVVEKGGTLDWEKVGQLRKGLGQEWKFIPAATPELQKPVIAEKVLREKAAHRVRVGEEDKSSEEMSVLLQRTAPRRDWGLVTGFVLCLLAAGFITGYFISRQGGSSETGNRELQPASVFEVRYQPVQP